MFSWLFRILLILWISCGFIMAMDIPPKQELTGVPFYEDEGASLRFEEVVAKKFSPNEKKVASFGFTSSAYWFKVELEALENAGDNRWWLQVAYPLLDEIDLYICDLNSSLLDVKYGGKLRAFSQRDLKDKNFLFSLDRETKQILYLRVKTQSSMQVPLSIQSSEGLLVNEHYLYVLSGLYYGIVLIIFFYNLLSFIYTRRRDYFLYLVFVGAFSLYQLALDGLGMRFFWSGFDWMIIHGNGTMMGLMTLSIIMFTRYFLQTRSFVPRLDKVLVGLAVLMLLTTVMGTFRPYGEVIPLLAGISVILPPMLIYSGIVAYKNKFEPARFYIIGWGCFLGGSVLFAMNKFAWIEGFEFLAYAQQIGSVLQMVFLSWALADQHKQSEREYLQKLSGLNTLLQEKVDEALVQVRQNDQVLIEKSRLAAMGEMIEQIAHQWRQPLQTLALINQNLYFKVQLGTVHKDDCVNAHDKINDQLQYMSQTIDDFRNFSQPHKEKEVFVLEEVLKSALNLSEGSLKYAKIQAHNFSKEEHLCYGMRHEMMQVFMNLIKNVQDVVLQNKLRNIWIKFFIEKKGEETVIRVEDNAGGIDEEIIEKVFKPYFSTKTGHEGTGIGLYMSREIIEQSMSGRINVTNSEHGAVFEIVLPSVSLYEQEV